MKRPEDRRATRMRTVVATLALAALALVGCGASGNPNAPTATVTQPASDTGTSDVAWTYDGYDEGRGQYYKDVTLMGSADDVEDGALSGAALRWTTDRDDLQDVDLGTGSSVSVRLYSDACTGTWHEITLTATDAGGKTGTDVRRIHIWTLC